jgi:hydroxypyruvate reductase
VILGDRVAAGSVNVKYGYTAPTRQIALHEAGHPVPDQAGVAGTRAMIDLVRGCGADDLVLCLISGGGSALMPLPVEGVALEDMQALTGALLRSGAPIQAINAVRKHLSQIAGGQLARLVAPARVVSLILSDVVGNPLDVIASGPTVPDTTTFGTHCSHRAVRIARAGRKHPAAPEARPDGRSAKGGRCGLARVQTIVVDNGPLHRRRRTGGALGFPPYCSRPTSSERAKLPGSWPRWAKRSRRRGVP